MIPITQFLGSGSWTNIRVLCDAYRVSSVVRDEQSRKLSQKTESSLPRSPKQKKIASNNQLKWRSSCKRASSNFTAGQAGCPSPVRGLASCISYRILQTAQTNDSTRTVKLHVIPEGTAFVGSSIMSASERTQTAETSQKIEYTVKQTAKIHKEKQRDSRSSLWLSVTKCIIGIFLFASVLTCLVASKVSLLSMASFSSRKPTDAKTNQETLFIMIVLVLMIPEGFSFLKACWTSLLRKNHRWPCKKALIVVSFLLKSKLSYYTKLKFH